MKIQIKNSHKVIGGITFLVALMSITAFKAIETYRANPKYFGLSNQG